MKTRFCFTFLLFMIYLLSAAQQVDYNNDSLQFERIFNEGISQINLIIENDIYDDSVIVDNFSFRSFSFDNSHIEKDQKFVIFYSSGKISKVVKYNNLENYNTVVYVRDTGQFYYFCIKIEFKLNYVSSIYPNRHSIFFPHFIINDKSDSTNTMIGFLPRAEFLQEECCINTLKYSIGWTPFILLNLDEHLTPKYRVSFVENIITGVSSIKFKNGAAIEQFGFPIISTLERRNLNCRVEYIPFNRLKIILLGYLPNYFYANIESRYEYMNTFYYLDALKKK